LTEKSVYQIRRLQKNRSREHSGFFVQTFSKPHMRRIAFLIPVFLFSVCAQAQSLHVGVFGGISNYQGDLVDKLFVKHNAKAAAGITAHYPLTEHWTLRGGFLFTKLTANDKYNATALQARNLSFTTSVSELSFVGEYATFNLDDKRWTPYLFGGVALFHFDPYTFDEDGQKVFLKPLSTEGQGIDGYTAARPYSRTQIALPFGAGFRYAVTDNVRVGLELGIRKSFTDHLDDVSTNYADAADLLRERGQLAVDYAYRGDEVPGGNPSYPEKGAQRGGSLQKDYYYTTGLTVSFRLGGTKTSASSGGKRRGYGCPASPL
jgi:opacity protein-like surface antigen